MLLIRRAIGMIDDMFWFLVGWFWAQDGKSSKCERANTPGHIKIPEDPGQWPTEEEIDSIFEGDRSV
ncbi:MAG: hypothetical protein ACRCYP_01670 [Alphaproteobacteria bacterium]